MKITVTIDGKTYKGKQPYEGAAHVEVEAACPHCGEKSINVAGTGQHIDPEARHETYRADAIHYSVECGKQIGEIRCKVDTLFGLEEDLAVSRLGTKIY